MGRNLATMQGSAGKDEYVGLRLTQRRFASVSQPQTRWPALDGLRAVAVLAVMIFHLDDGSLLPGGYLGVDLFFVLSGFLITSLLIREWDNSDGCIGLRNFYVRRCLRLFPALGCIIAASAGLAVLLELGGGTDGRASAQTTLDGIPWVICYVGNWVHAFNLDSLGLLGQTWSLAVEEQFYLVWPAIFIFIISHCNHRICPALWLAILALAVMTYRMIMARYGYTYDRIYFGTDTHCDGLLIGCAAAFWMNSWRSSELNRLGCRMLRCGTWLGGAGLIVIFVLGSNSECPLEISAAALASVAVVVGLATGVAPTTITRMLSSSLAVWIGRRSYGLYLWHYIVYVSAISFFNHYTSNIYHGGLSAHQIPIDLTYISAFFASFIVAALSYRFVESPALGLQERYRSGQRSGGAHRMGARRPTGRQRDNSLEDEPRWTSRVRT